MPSLAELHQAVAATLASKRLGTPVFVRCTLQGRDRTAVSRRLAQTVAVVRDWLGQKLDLLHSHSSKDGGQVALTLRFDGGATALVSHAAGSPRGDGVDLLVLGNRGSLTHDAGQAELTGDGLDTALPAPEPELLAWVERAIRSGKPEAAEGRP
jgi:hypothetical protein